MCGPYVDPNSKNFLWHDQRNLDSNWVFYYIKLLKILGCDSGIVSCDFFFFLDVHAQVCIAEIIWYPKIIQDQGCVEGNSSYR